MNFFSHHMTSSPCVHLCQNRKKYLVSNQIVQVLRPRWHLEKVLSRCLVYSDQISLSISIFFFMFQVCDQMACQVFQVHIDKPTRQGWSSADWPGYIFQQTYFQHSITVPFNRAISWRNTFLLHYLTERIVIFFALRIIYAWFDKCHHVSNQ